MLVVSMIRLQKHRKHCSSSTNCAAELRFLRLFCMKLISLSTMLFFNKTWADCGPSPKMLAKTQRAFSSSSRLVSFYKI